MTDDNSIKSLPSSLIKTKQVSKTEEQPKSGGSLTGGVTNGANMGEQEFLMLLVNQLQHQDPLNPMQNEEFAVQLAQFSSLEQLIGINEKLSAGTEGGGGQVGMMASFLGHEVVLKDQVIKLNGVNNPNLLVDFPEGTQSARVDFLDENGQIVGSKNIDQVEAGKQVVSLKGEALPDGQYGIRVVGVGPNGQFQELPAKVSGTVEGFVVEPEPALLVNGENIPLEEVAEVYAGKA